MTLFDDACIVFNNMSDRRIFTILKSQVKLMHDTNWNAIYTTGEFPVFPNWAQHAPIESKPLLLLAVLMDAPTMQYMRATPKICGWSFSILLYKQYMLVQIHYLYDVACCLRKFNHHGGCALNQAAGWCPTQNQNKQRVWIYSIVDKTKHKRRTCETKQLTVRCPSLCGCSCVWC